LERGYAPYRIVGRSPGTKAGSSRKGEAFPHMGRQSRNVPNHEKPD
jgi:hypothetical protein